MSKNIILTIATVVTFVATSFGQQKVFTYNSSGLNPEYLVVKVDKFSKGQLYQRTLNWVKETYKSPDKVIKSKIEDKMIRIRGYNGNLVCVRALGMNFCMDVFYTIEIDFKDGKYRFMPVGLDVRVPINEKPGGYPSIYLNDGSDLYKGNGDVKNRYKYIPSSISNFFTGLNLQLKKYILSAGKSYGNDDW